MLCKRTRAAGNRIGCDVDKCTQIGSEQRPGTRRHGILDGVSSPSNAPIHARWGHTSRVGHHKADTAQACHADGVAHDYERTNGIATIDASVLESSPGHALPAAAQHRFRGARHGSRDVLDSRGENARHELCGSHCVQRHVAVQRVCSRVVHQLGASARSVLVFCRSWHVLEPVVGPRARVRSAVVLVCS